MRLLHTSDWHLGQSLHQYDRADEHRHFLEWLIDTLVEEEVDALLIAGDVFDHGNPSAAAQAMLYRFLSEATRRLPQLKIVMTAGNHDSPGRLEAPAPLLSVFGAHAVGQVEHGEDGPLLERIVLPLRNQAGEIRAWCIAMPFLRPGDVPRIDEADDPYAAGIEMLYREAIDLANTRRKPGQALIALGHCHLVGGQVSEESERRIMIGGTEALPARIFDESVAYVALGHLHRPQQIGGDPTRRYSGSPLPMSFSEIDYPHQVVLVELDGESVGEIRALRVPRRVGLLRVPEKPAPLREVLAALDALELPEQPVEAHWPYLQVRVRLDAPEPDLRARIEARLQDKPVRLARIETSHARDDRAADAPPLSIDALNAADPADFFTRLYQHRYGQPVPDELMAAFAELLQGGQEAA